MAIRTVDLDALISETGNTYETVVIISKRARQISSKIKAELDEKLAYYEGFGTEMENLRLQEEQARISIDYETRPKPAEVSIDEMLRHEIYHRNPNEE